MLEIGGTSTEGASVERRRREDRGAEGVSEYWGDMSPSSPRNRRSCSTWRRICSSDILNVGALEMLRNCALQIDIYLHTYLRTSNSGNR